MLKLASDKPAVEEVWPGSAKTGVFPINMTPFGEGDDLYGVDQPGDLMAVDVKTGKRVWATFDPVSGKKNRAAARPSS